jgi:hypothetical protein
MKAQDENSCPRCLYGRLRSWPELTADEQEIVKRLPGSAKLSLDQRKALSRWCAKCWHEEGSRETRA